MTTLASLSEVDASAWDRLAGADNPFVTHAFLGWLEASGAVGGRTGWAPRHVVVFGADGQLVAAAPSYAKTHSEGEYIFDWGWADAAYRARVPYYPKLLTAVPFTPATGPRLLAADDTSRRSLIAALRAEDVHGGHVLFCTTDEQQALAEAGWLARSSLQYHLHNQGWTCLDDWLGSLSSRRRKEVRRERAQAQSHGLTLAVEHGADLSAEDIEQIWRCYRSTIDAYGARPYLPRAWWEGLRGALAPMARVATARADGQLVAMALAFQRGSALYGRYWGALGNYRALHFELCYYQLIDHALKTGCGLVEAGAQGEHKIARGFLPVITRSAHWLRHPGLQEAVAKFVEHEAGRLAEVSEVLADRSPYSASR